MLVQGSSVTNGYTNWLATAAKLLLLDTTNPLLHNSQATLYNVICSVSLKCKIKKKKIECFIKSVISSHEVLSVLNHLKFKHPLFS